MKGTISKITGGEAKSGGRYENWVIDGEKYSTKKFVGCAQEGDTIEFDFLKNGDFKNLTKVELIPSGPQGGKDTNEYIIREVAIKAAAEAIKQFKFDPSDEIGNDTLSVAHQVIKIAKEFEAYIKGDDKPKLEDDVPF